MGRTENFVIGLILGAVAGAAAAYIFGPARATTFDSKYQSRWDRALAEGKEAELSRKAELEAELAETKRRNTPGRSA